MVQLSKGCSLGALEVCSSSASTWEMPTFFPSSFVCYRRQEDGEVQVCMPKILQSCDADPRKRTAFENYTWRLFRSASGQRAVLRKSSEPRRLLEIFSFHNVSGNCEASDSQVPSA